MEGDFCPKKVTMVEQILQELERKGYSRILSVVDRPALESINRFFDENKARFEAARVGDSTNKQRMENIRGDFTLWIDPLNPPEEFGLLVSVLDSIKEKVNERFFLGLKQYESHLAYYPPGTFYKKHLDRHEKESTRRLTFIFYLNSEWKDEYGGELVLYDKKGEILETFFPLPGSMITFISDEFPHEVKAAVRERRSFTGWMHTRILY